MSQAIVLPNKQLPQDEGSVGPSHQEIGDSSMQSVLCELDVPESEEDQLETNQGPQLDWDTIALYAPTDQDVPLFQSAQIRRKEATQRLEAAYRIAMEDFKRYTDEILDCVGNLYRADVERLDRVEMDIQNLFESNTYTRSAMEHQLEESMKASEAEIKRVLMKVSANKNN